jgi:DNA polymerase III epsilon subunit-like protein
MNALFDFYPRDTMGMALAVNDAAQTLGASKPFKSVGLGNLCRQLGIINERPHDAYYDCCATGALYGKLVNYLAHGLPALNRGA